jgi:hypothetical protein
VLPLLLPRSKLRRPNSLGGRSKLDLGELFERGNSPLMRGDILPLSPTLKGKRVALTLSRIDVVDRSVLILADMSIDFRGPRDLALASPSLLLVGKSSSVVC